MTHRSQLEWRTAIQLSNDEVGLKEILSGEDIHSKNQVAFELPTRTIAKIYLFSTIYRKTGWGFANDPDFMHVSTDPKFWDDLHEKFYSKYYGLNKCHQRWKDLVVNGDIITGPLAQSWKIPMKRDNYGNLKIPWTVLTNYPVQGTGAAVMMFARISAYNRIKKRNLNCSFISTVHDSIVIDTPKVHVQELCDIFYQVFDDLPTNFKRAVGCDWQVPLTCECKAGMNMKDMEKLKRS